MGKLITFTSHKTNEHTRGRLTHKTWKIECLCEKDMCMGELETLTGHKTNEWTCKREAYTQYIKMEHLCEKDMSMGKPEMLVGHKTNGHTRGRLTHKTWKFKHLCEMGRCPSHETNEQTRGKLTNNTWKFKRLCEEERCMESPKCSLITRQSNKWEESLHTRHGNSNVFVKRRGVWEARNAP